MEIVKNESLEELYQSLLRQFTHGVSDEDLNLIRWALNNAYFIGRNNLTKLG